MFRSKFLRATAELAALTYVSSFLGLLLASEADIINLSALKSAAAAAMSPALTVVYGALLRLKGDWNSPLGTDTRERPVAGNPLPK